MLALVALFVSGEGADLASTASEGNRTFSGDTFHFLRQQRDQQRHNLQYGGGDNSPTGHRSTYIEATRSGL